MLWEIIQEKIVSIPFGLLEIVNFAWPSSSTAAMEAATTKLTEATGGVAQKMYAAQQAEGASSETATEEADDADQGDVVDAEFEEVKEDKRA